MKRWISFSRVLAMIVPLVLSCSYQELMDAIDVKRPTVQFQEMQWAGLSFDQADVVFLFDLYNPNGIGVIFPRCSKNSELCSAKISGGAPVSNAMSLKAKIRNIAQTYNSAG